MHVRISLEDPAQPEIVELLRQAEANGASLYPAESNHFLPIDALRAPNVLFVVAVNRAGTERLRDVETRYYGRSCIIAPRGELLAEAGEGEPDVAVAADVDLADVAAARRRLWVYRDRRPELYGLVAAASTTASPPGAPGGTDA